MHICKSYCEKSVAPFVDMVYICDTLCSVYRMMQCFAVMVRQIRFCDHGNLLNITAAKDFEESCIALNDSF